jgi:hypothetical protein
MPIDSIFWSYLRSRPSVVGVRHSLIYDSSDLILHPNVLYRIVPNLKFQVSNGRDSEYIELKTNPNVCLILRT